ncbi:MAG TPA: Ig-like domain-containing protein, partial [Gemmatimonadaceae bacterium]|nr:Ig-like domain-containing protein [Gemmatimonadaceae bacterium]
MSRHWRGSAAMTALFVSACLAPMDPSKADVELVHVTFGAARRTVDTIAVRATTRANAVAYAAEGHDVGITRFEFSSSNAAVASVDSLGTVRGVSPGTAVITARAPSGKEGSATIVVIPSTIAYRITVGGPPEALAFSVDATRLYVPVRPDSLAVIDALGQLRVATVFLGAGANRAAATTSHVIAFEAGSSSAALLSAATERASGALALGAPSHDIVALGERAYVAQGGAGRIAIIEGN